MSDADVDAWLEFDRGHLWHPYASMGAPLPTYPVVGAEGVRIRLSDGRELVDGMSNWWAAIHGHGHPALVAALTKQARELSHVMFGGFTHGPAVELGRELLAIVPPGLTRIFYCDSGSVAVEVAIKMALQYWHAPGEPGRTRLLALRGGYHGDTFQAMSVCDPVTGMHGMFRGVLTEQLFAPRPPCRFGDPCTDADIAPLSDLLTAHRDELAAVILEPIVQGAGGMHFYSADYLARVRALCDAHDVLLICDEIATGFGRTGRMFACEHADVAPDILCVGKALTGGMLSLAATLCSDRVADRIGQGSGGGALMHGPTFMANPLACATALASVRVLRSSDLPADVGRIEAGLREGLAPAAELDAVADVRVLGAIGVVEMKEAVDVARAQARFVEAGVWVRPFGRLVYLMPPFIIEDGDLSRLTGAVVRWATNPD